MWTTSHSVNAPDGVDMEHTYPETTYKKFMAGESSDDVILIGRPSHMEVAADISRIIGGGEVGARHGYCAPYARQTNYQLTFRSPVDPQRVFEFWVNEDSHPDPKGDDPWSGLMTNVSCPRDDEAFAVLTALAGVYGGWTRRTEKVRDLVHGLRATPETAEWTRHDGPGTVSPAFKAEVALHKLGLDGWPLYGVMADRNLLDSVIGILTDYRSATTDGVDRLPGSGERTRDKESREYRGRMSLAADKWRQSQ